MAGQPIDPNPGGGGASTTSGGTTKSADPFLGQTAFARIVQNDGTGGVDYDRVAPLAMHWHHHKDVLRWQPHLAVDRQCTPTGDWNPDFSQDVASYVWSGHRVNDADKWCFGLLSQVLVLPTDAHQYGKTKPDGHQCHRLEIGIDRAHHYHTDAAHGPLAHIGIDSWASGSGIKRPVWMHFWAASIGGDDKWHWYTRTPAPAPSTPPAPKAPSTPPGPGTPTTPSTPNPGPVPTGPVPTGGGGGTDGGGTGGEPGGDPGGDGQPYPPWDPNDPNNPNPPFPGGPPSKWGSPFDLPLPGTDWGGFNPFGPPQNAGFTPEAQATNGVDPPTPQYHRSEAFGWVSRFEGNATRRDQVANGRTQRPSRWERGSTPYPNAAHAPARPSRWARGHSFPTDEGALATPDAADAIDWTGDAIDTEEHSQTDVDSLREDLDRVTLMARDNAQGRRIQDLDARLRSIYLDVQEATIVAPGLTATVTTAYPVATGGGTPLIVGITPIGAANGELHAQNFAGGNGAVATFDVAISTPLGGNLTVHVACKYPVERATAIAWDAAV